MLRLRNDCPRNSRTNVRRKALIAAALTVGGLAYNKARHYTARVPDWIEFSVVAHRGLHTGERPENSRAALVAAGQTRCSVEFDVQAVQGDTPEDVVAMLIHDERMDRLTNGASYAVARHTPAAQLREMHILGTPEKFIDFNEALDAILASRPHSGFGLLIDVKSDAIWDRSLEHELARILTERRDEFEPGTLMITAFNPMALLWYRRHLPWIGRSMAAIEVEDALESRRAYAWLAVLTRSWLMLPLIKPDMISAEFNGLPAAWIDKWRDRTGGKVFAWTIKDPNDLVGGTTPIFEDFDPEAARRRGLRASRGQRGWHRPDEIA